MVRSNSQTIDHPSCRIIGLLIQAFLVSWGAYLVGFCLLLLTWPLPQPEQGQGDNNSNNKNVITLSKTDPSLYPFYATLIGGPILGLTGILHAVLTGTASSITGAVSIVLSTMYFVCAGHVAYTSRQTIAKAANDPYTAELDTVSLSLLLMLVGVVAEALCWLSVMTVTVTRYKKCHAENNEQRLNSKEQKILLSYLPFSLDLARKLSVMFILLSATGWLILASCISLDGYDEIYEVGTFYVGPILFLIALLHTGCSERMGVLTCILSMLYVMLMGAGLISYGEAVRLHQYRSRTHTDYCTMLAGGIVSLISWTCVLVLCQFYHARSPQEVQGVGESYYIREKQQKVNHTLIDLHLLPTTAKM